MLIVTQNEENLGSGEFNWTFVSFLKVFHLLSKRLLSHDVCEFWQGSPFFLGRLDWDVRDFRRQWTFSGFCTYWKGHVVFLSSVGMLLHSWSTLTRSVMVSQATKTSSFLLLTFRGSWVKTASKLWSRPCDSHLCDIWHSTTALWPDLKLYWNTDLSITPLIGVSKLSNSKAINKLTPATVNTERPKGHWCLLIAFI